MNPNDKLAIRKLRSSYLTSVVSISLVLFMIGLVGILALISGQLSNYVKENINVSVILKDNVKDIDVKHLQKTLDASDYIKSTKFVSKEEAAKSFEKELGEDFTNFLGYNPLLSSIDVKLKANYANIDSLKIIEKRLLKSPEVKEVFYQKSLIHLVNQNVKKISILFLIFSALLFLISLTLINNTIRLSVYSKRLLINTMQLVGATRNFIRRPFLFKSIILGLIASFVAIVLLSVVIYYFQREVYQIISFKNIDLISILFVIVIIIGALISLISTYFSVNKYLRMKSQNLYM